MTRIIHRGNIALRNLNEITEKYSSWVNRWYYGLGSLECRVCDNIIVDKHDVCLYNSKIMHVACASDFIEQNKHKWGDIMACKCRFCGKFATEDPCIDCMKIKRL